MQQSAGNRAVGELLGGGAPGVQRAPDDPPKDRSPAATAPTAAGDTARRAARPEPPPTVASPSALATTVFGAGSPPPSPKGAIGDPRAGGTVPTLSGLPGAQPGQAAAPPNVASPTALAPTIAGVGNPPPSPVGSPAAGGGASARPAHWARAVPVTAADVDAAYAKDPTKVIRSPTADWHDQMFALDAGSGSIPRAFRVGDMIAVSPDHPSPATPLPGYAATGNVGLGGPAAAPAPAPPAVVDKSKLGGSSTIGSVAGPAPSQGGRPPAGQPRVGRPEHWDKAVPATDDEVAAAFRRNPQSVVRSPNHEWHENIYDLDEGSGEQYPRAFKIGNQYAVSPDYKGPATAMPQYSAGSGAGPGGMKPPPAGAAGPAGPVAAPTAPAAAPASAGPVATPAAGGGAKPAQAQSQAAQTVALPHTEHSDKTRGRRYDATVTESGGGTVTRDRKRELGHVVTGVETQQGDLKHRKEKNKGVVLGTDGNVVALTAGRRETTKIGDDVSVAKGTQATAGITNKGELAIGANRKKEVVTGRNPAGDPVVKSSESSAKIILTPDSAGAAVDHKITGPGGTQTNVGGSFTADNKGNASASATAGMTNKSGQGASVTVGTAHTVSAEDPVEVSPGVWEVSYVISDGTSVGGGLSARAPGGIGLGAGASVTNADLKTGSRRFTDEKEATKFKDNAAARIEKDGSLGYFPPTSIVGALMIPIGDARGAGSSHSKSGSVSATFGATVSKSGHSTTSGELSVRRVGPVTVHVTATVAKEKGSDWGISGGLLSNESGGSESTSFAITFEFNLGTKEGTQAFERFVSFPLPPTSGARRISVRTIGAQEDHDKYSMLGGNAAFTGTTWQDKTEDEQGEHEKYGGKASHDQKPGRVLSLLGDKEQHSNAQIVRTQENNKDTGGRAQFDVSGESGDYNRAEFGKIFMGAKYSGSATASGKWTLSAQVPLQKIRELEESNKELRNAKTMDEKMRIYSELVKANGGQMLGGQVGITSKAWDLELKGDDNFPGERGRQRLKDLRKSLTADLKAKPDSANEIVRQASEEIERLQKRKAGVSDLKRYTDLPDGLRQQQLAVIEQHIEEFKSVRRNAQAAAMKQAPSQTGGDEDVKLADQEYVKLQVTVGDKESSISALRKEVRDSSKALGDAIGPKGSTALKFDVDSAVAQVQIAMGKSWIAQATDADKKQAALDPRIDELRNAWTAAQDPKDRLAALKALEKVLDERLKLMNMTIYYIREAAKAVYPITTRSAMSGNPAFWQSLGMRQEEKEEPPTTSMAL